MADEMPQNEPACSQNDTPAPVEDDVPPDFFDIFTNQDFMAGLNVVDDDEWDDKQSKEKPKEEVKGEKKKPTSESEKKPRTSTRDSSRKKDDHDNRRDPAKTKRDIQQNKEKCAKDREKKSIDARLSMVETGLIPPGMEMEVDMEQVMGKPAHKSRSRDRKPRVSSSPKRNSNRTNRTSPYNRRRRSPQFRRSPRTSAARRSPSPRPMERPRVRISPYRRHERMSPARLRRDRSFSPKRHRRRSFSRSPRRTHHEKTFLEEIAEKLNEPANKRVMVPQMQPQFVAVPPQAVPVPPPTFFPVNTNVQTVYDPFDSQFFVGNSNVAIPTNVNASYLPVVPQPKVIPVAPFNVANNYTVPRLPEVKPQAVPSGSGTNKFELENMLKEKRISLSDFLSINAKAEGAIFTLSHGRRNTVRTTNSDDVHTKIKVISRCQDAIRFLNNQKVFSGRLKVQPTIEATVDSKASPLSRSYGATLPFTTHEIIPEDEQYLDTLNKLLKSVGIHKTISMATPPREPSPVIKPVVVEPLAPPPPSISSSSSSRHTEQRHSSSSRSHNKSHTSSSHRSATLNKMVQTDPTSCQDCEKRKRLKYSQIGVQCGGIQVSIGTQTIDEEPPRKTQSMMNFTPAQLLGRTTEQPSRYARNGADDIRRRRDEVHWEERRRYEDYRQERMLRMEQAPPTSLFLPNPAPVDEEEELRFSLLPQAAPAATGFTGNSRYGGYRY